MKQFKVYILCCLDLIDSVFQFSPEQSISFHDVEKLETERKDKCNGEYHDEARLNGESRQ